MQSIVTLSHARHFCRCVYVGGGGGVLGARVKEKEI